MTEQHSLWYLSSIFHIKSSFQWVRTGLPSTTSPVHNTHTHTHTHTHRTWTPSAPLMLHKCQERQRRGEEWQSVFVPGPNEAGNAVNRLFTRFTMAPSALKRVGDVWRGTPLTGRTLLSSVSQGPAAHVGTLCLHHPTCMHFISIIRPPSPLCAPLLLSHPRRTHSHLAVFFFLLQEHIFKLMKSDSYARFLRSNIYQDLLLARKKVSCTHWPPVSPQPIPFLIMIFLKTLQVHVYCLYAVST